MMPLIWYVLTAANATEAALRSASLRQSGVAKSELKNLTAASAIHLHCQQR